MIRATALAAALLALAFASAAAAPAGPAGFAALPGHRIVGLSLDRDWLAIAEDPTAKGTCPAVVLVRVPSGSSQALLTRPGGPSCRFGGRFWVRPGARAIGNAIERALWVLRNGSSAIAVKASPTEPEVVLQRVSEITAQRGPFLGPVVATNWLRLFGDYSISYDGKSLIGGVISANNRELYAAQGPVLPLGLDDAEHVVSIGLDGGIAMWQAHGARYGSVPAAHAQAAALDLGEVLILRGGTPQLDIRQLSGQLVRSWPVAPGAAPLLDADVAHDLAVYIAGGDVHELHLDTGADRVVASAPSGSTLIDAQIEPGVLAYAYAGGPAAAGRVVVVSP